MVKKSVCPGFGDPSDVGKHLKIYDKIGSKIVNVMINQKAPSILAEIFAVPAGTTQVYCLISN